MIDVDVLLADWLEIVDQSTPDIVTVVFAEETIGENRPKPAKPYITLKLISGPKSPAGSENINPSDPGDPTEFIMSSLRQFTMSVQAFGAGASNLLSDLQTQLYSEGIKEDGTLNIGELIKQKDIGIVDRGTVSNITGKLGVGFEKRAQLDIIFNKMSNVDLDIGVIEKVSIKGEIKNPDDSIITIPKFTVT